MNNRSHSRLRRFQRRRGAVQMEYVILAVLIAAAAVVAVVMFGRSVTGTMITAADAATLEHTKAKTDFTMRRGDRAQDAQAAKQYHDSMHK